jgi:hypothetical protein
MCLSYEYILTIRYIIISLLYGYGYEMFGWTEATIN